MYVCVAMYKYLNLIYLFNKIFNYDQLICCVIYHLFVITKLTHVVVRSLVRLVIYIFLWDNNFEYVALFNNYITKNPIHQSIIRSVPKIKLTVKNKFLLFWKITTNKL